jgi:hypothetical protein
MILTPSISLCLQNEDTNNSDKLQGNSQKVDIFYHHLPKRTMVELLLNTSDPEIDRLKLNAYFSTRIATAKMAETELGIPEHRVTTYKTKLLKSGELVNISKARCLLSGRSVWWFTTSPELIKKNTKSKQKFNKAKSISK